MAMFGRQKEGSASETRINTVIGEGTTLAGTLRVEGSVLVNGDFEGTLAATESVVVGKTGNVRAGVSAREIMVAGRIRGKLVAKDRVELQTGARLEGDVFAKSFMIEEGVFFQGNCSMGEEAGLEEPHPVKTAAAAGGTPSTVPGTASPDSRKPAPDLGLLGQR